ncbi:MAG: transcriptional regulator NrdR [Candidatus Gracilibacteria bacterium]|nr:transcriptional regulator NrdR [Candidatus Gracilibacteria bacterium]
MYCIYCGNTDTKVLDSRLSEDGSSIKRRRECLNCSNRFNTFEKYEKIELTIEKKSGKIEDYNRKKLEESIQKAFNKRNLSFKKLDLIISQVESKLLNKRKIASEELANYVLENLKEIDESAYIRYASAYNNFKTKEDYLDFINKNL